MKHKKYLLYLLTLLLLVASIVGVTAVQAAESDLSLGGMTIYLPENPSTLEKTAATELEIYLEEITGVDSPVVRTNDTALSGIFIGRTMESATAGVYAYPNEVGNGEGWAIEVKDGSIYLTGGETRGVLYAVYHLLEDVLGVRWWNMWEEYVPTGDALMPADYFDSGEPIFTYRDIYFAENAQSLFHVRNRLNGFAGWIPAQYGGEADYTGPYHVHTFGRYFPASSYFKTHPEWYAWDADTQTRITDGQLCLSNEALLKEFTKKVLNSIRSAYDSADRAGRPRPLYTDVSPDDRGGHCECDACLASKAVSGESGHLFKFVNKIAAEVAKVYPDIKVETLAYAQYLELPLDDTVPADNVVIRLAPNDMDIMHSLDHPNNAKGKARMEAWAELLQPGQLIYWDYGMLTQRFNGTMPNFFRFANDYQTLYEAGGSGVFLENGSLNCAEMWDARAWIAAKIIENPYQDVYEVAKDFATGYYGPAGGMDVYNYMVLAEQAAADYNKVTKFGNLTIDAQWMTAAEALQANQYFEDAVAKTKADTSITEAERQVYLDRINVARNALDRTILYNFERFATESAANGIYFNLSKAETGRRVVTALDWLDNQTAGEDLSGMQKVKRRGDYNSSAWYLLGRYARYKGETDENGEMFWPEIPQEIFDDYPGLDPAHIYDYPVSALGYTEGVVSKVANAASYPGGSALVWDHKTLLKSQNGDGFSFSDTKYITSNLEKKLRIGDPLIADGQYHLYRMADISLPYPGRATLSLMNSVSMSLEGLDQFQNNKKADIYFSMKIEGDPSGTDPSNYATVYLDRIILVDTCENYTVTAASGTKPTCQSGVNMGICPICGKAAEATNKPAHTVTGGYTYDAAQNRYAAQCDVCGETVEYSFEGQLPEDLLSALAEDGIGLGHIREYMVTDFELTDPPKYVKDSETPVGEAVRLNAWDLPNPSIYIISPGESITISSHPGHTIGSIPHAQLKPNENMGYQVYKLADCVLPTEGHGYTYYWWLFNWQLQSRLMQHDLYELNGRTADVYLSMKIEGKIDNDRYRDQGPVYYLDRFFVVDRCEDHMVLTDEVITEATCQNNVWMKAVCSVCGTSRAEEIENSTVDHAFGDFVYNETLHRFESACTFGCGELELRNAYTVTFQDGSKVSTEILMEGDTVAKPEDPDRHGYRFKGWYDGDVIFDFSTPITADLTLTAKFREVTNITAPAEPAVPTVTFPDVTPGDWFYDGVRFCVEQGLLEGFEDGTFRPNAVTSRAMIVTVLWRLEGKPEGTFTAAFADVSQNSWYAEPIHWAQAAGIVEGISETCFAPNDTVTREQLAVILWRYCKYKGYDVSVGENTNILSYDDALTVSQWAIPAIQWACGAGIMEGSDGNLTPQGHGTRAQTAVLLRRFCQAIA